jgi:hypothetical protein
MAQVTRVPISSDDSRQVICCIRFRTYPQPPASTVIATDAAGNTMAEVVRKTLPHNPAIVGYVVRLRAQGCAIPRFRDSESFYPSYAAAEEAYWLDADAAVFHEHPVIAWEPWREAMAVAAE